MTDRPEQILEMVRPGLLKDRHEVRHVPSRLRCPSRSTVRSRRTLSITQSGARMCQAVCAGIVGGDSRGRIHGIVLWNVAVKRHHGPWRRWWWLALSQGQRGARGSERLGCQPKLVQQRALMIG